MTPQKRGLQEVAPLPIADERTPLLADGEGAEDQDEEALEARAAQERREYETNAVPIADEPSTKKLVLTMSSLWFSTFFAALDATIVATLSGPISASFNSFTLFSWLASSYLIANAAFQPLSGKLTDIYGRRAGLVFASTFFAAGTLMCGLATEQWVIILGRLIAGAGGGCLNTISTFVGSDLVPLRKRGVWQGIGNIVFGTGMGLGGLLGGYVHDTLGWRWAFYIQVPFIVVAGIATFFTVKVPIKHTDEMLTTIPLSVVSLLVFILIEDRIASEPIIPVRLLLNQTVAAACLTNWFETMAVFGLLYYVPVYFQTVGGLSSTAAGARLIPQSAGAAIGSLSSGLLMRATGKYRLLNFFMQCMSLAAAAAILGTFNAHVAAAPPFIYLLMHGTAYGSMLTITLISLIAAVDHKHQAVITSASYAFRSTGSTIGITLSSTVFQNLLKSGLWERFGSLPNAAAEIGRIRDSVDEAKHLPSGWSHDGVVDSYVDALRGVWALVLGFATMAAVCSFFIRQHTLYKSLERK
ncbi:hypothetical protein LTR95_001449 [Oleoguttula sp. CCFEE 5521]